MLEWMKPEPFLPGRWWWQGLPKPGLAGVVSSFGFLSEFESNSGIFSPAFGAPVCKAGECERDYP
jgi:hypothetical protein